MLTRPIQLALPLVSMGPDARSQTDAFRLMKYMHLVRRKWVIFKLKPLAMSLIVRHISCTISFPMLTGSFTHPLESLSPTGLLGPD
jgi:hypothetical protein